MKKMGWSNCTRSMRNILKLSVLAGDTRQGSYTLFVIGRSQGEAKPLERFESLNLLSV